MVRGKGIASRMCSIPHNQAVTRSTPMPNPECGTDPYLRNSKFQEIIDQSIVDVGGVGVIQ